MVFKQYTRKKKKYFNMGADSQVKCRLIFRGDSHISESTKAVLFANNKTL